MLREYWISMLRECWISMLWEYWILYCSIICYGTLTLWQSNVFHGPYLSFQYTNIHIIYNTNTHKHIHIRLKFKLSGIQIHNLLVIAPTLCQVNNICTRIYALSMCNDSGMYCSGVTAGVVGGMLKAFPGPDPLQGCLVWLWHLLLVHCTCSKLLLLTTRLAFSWVSAPLLHPLKTSKYFWLLPVKTSKCLWLIINDQAFSDSSLLHWTERIETYSATTEKSWPICYCLKT